MLQTLAADQYDVHTFREPAVIVPEWNISWPSTRGLINAVQVNYTAGYTVGGSPSDEKGQQDAVPDTVKTWMHARLATLFEQRQQIITGTIVNALPRAYVDGLLDEVVMSERVVG